MVPVSTKKRWQTPQAQYISQRTGLSDPEVAIRKLVSDLLEEAEQSTPPIDLTLVASFKNIVRIRREELLGPAMLINSANGLEIVINSADAPARQNFSIAHEISHTFFFGCSSIIEGIDRWIGQFSPKLEEEYLCDVGASSLLFPPDLMAPLIEPYGCNLDAIRRIAGIFNGSIEATAITWARLSPWDCAVVFFEEKLKPTQVRKQGQMVFTGMEDILPQPELRINHACNSPSFPFFLPKHKSVRRTGPIYACLSKEQTSGLDVFVFADGIKQVLTESLLLPYNKNGERVNRVVSLIKPVR